MRRDQVCRLPPPPPSPAARVSYLCTTSLLLSCLFTSLWSVHSGVQPLVFLCPAVRVHNHTVLPSSHNSSYVYTNDSAYTNISATVGEDDKKKTKRKYEGKKLNKIVNKDPKLATQTSRKKTHSFKGC